MSFLRIKRVRGRAYVYEVETFRDALGRKRQRVLRYLGPTDPVYGGRGPVPSPRRGRRRSAQL